MYYTPTTIFSGAQWAIYMGTGAQALFFYDLSTIYYHRNQPPNEGSFPISDTSPMDSNSKPLNLWFNLPSNVIALTGQENTNRVLVLDSDLDIYFYEWTDSGDFNTDPPTLFPRGKLRLWKCSFSMVHDCPYPVIFNLLCVEDHNIPNTIESHIIMCHHVQYWYCTMSHSVLRLAIMCCSTCQRPIVLPFHRVSTTSNATAFVPQRLCAIFITI